MEKQITYENLRQFAYSNDKLIEGEIKGIVVEFFGLNCTKMFQEDPEIAREYAKKGILMIYPYNNPWCWMNRQAVELTDDVIAILCERYGLGETVKIVSTGGSMGGMSALVYSCYARITPVACVANCPVCDVVYHFTEREDLPRTFYSAYANESGSMEDALKAHSPLHLAEKMPDIPYTLFHCEMDQAVDPEMHSARFKDAMLAHHRRIRLIRVPGRGHCDLTPEAWEQYRSAILESLR